MFQLRASQRAEAAAFQRELRAERTSAYGAFLSALTEWKNEQINWYSRREDDSGGEIVQAARIESYRLKGIAQAALSRVQLVASSQALVIAADQAFELTRPIHSARDETGLEERKDQAMKAVTASSPWLQPTFNLLLLALTIVRTRLPAVSPVKETLS